MINIAREIALSAPPWFCTADVCCNLNETQSHQTCKHLNIFKSRIQGALWQFHTPGFSFTYHRENELVFKFRGWISQAHWFCWCWTLGAFRTFCKRSHPKAQWHLFQSTASSGKFAVSQKLTMAERCYRNWDDPLRRMHTIHKWSLFLLFMMRHVKINFLLLLYFHLRCSTSGFLKHGTHWLP